MGEGLPGNQAAAGAPGNQAHAGPRSLLAQALTVFQRSLSSMQIQVTGLLQFAVPLFPTAEVRWLATSHRAGLRRPGYGKKVSPPGSLAASFGFKGLSAKAAVCGFIHKPCPQRSCSASPSVCMFASFFLPASERSAQNPAPVEFIRVQPPPADGHVGLPGAAQGAGVALGARVEGGGVGHPSRPHLPREKAAEAGRVIAWAPFRLREWGRRGAWLLDSLQ